MNVFLQAVVGVVLGVGVFDNLVKVGLLNGSYLIRLGVILMISLIQICLGEECSRRGLCGTAFIGLNLRSLDRKSVV